MRCATSRDRHERDEGSAVSRQPTQNPQQHEAIGRIPTAARTLPAAMSRVVTQPRRSSSRYLPDVIDVPVVDRFEDGIGRFEADDAFDGRPIRVCFL